MPHGQLSSPISSDSHISIDGNKFLARHADGSSVPGKGPASDEAEVKTCPQNVQLKWMAEAASSIYSTPLITDLFSDGLKDVILPTFVHYLEALQGDDGAHAAGFPAFHSSKMHSSPLMFDIDQDGIQDIVVPTYDGDVLFFKDNGEKMPYKLTVPRLKVARDWYVGRKDHVDHSQPDAFDYDFHHTGIHGHQHPPAPQQVPVDVMGLQQQLSDLHTKVSESLQTREQEKNEHIARQQDASQQQPPPPVVQTVTTGAKRRRLLQVSQDGGTQQAQQVADGSRGEVGNPVGTTATPRNPDIIAGAAGVPPTAAGTRVGLPDTTAQAGAVGVTSTPTEAVLSPATVQAVPGGVLSPDGLAQGGALQSPPVAAVTGAGAGTGAGTGAVPGVEADPAGGLSEEAQQALDLDELDDGDELDMEDWHGEDDEDYDPHASLTSHVQGTADARLRDETVHPQPYDDYDFASRHYMGHDGADWGWGEDDFSGPPHPAGVVYLDVHIDAHIMCSPAIGDLDGDGHQELVIAVSYLFDQAYYDDAAHAGELDATIDKSMYVASGIVVFDLATHAVKWTQHLDLSTDHVSYRAYMYSTPTLADLDHDGKLEIIIGTSVGFLYALDHTGQPLPGFPVLMGEIQGQVAVADVDGDGFLELCAVDTRGNVAMFNRLGAPVWDRHVGYAVSQGVTFGDVNGDGRLDLVLGTGGGQIWALDAKTGATLPNFPFNTTGRVVAPVLITRLSDGPSQQLVVMCFDGFLYIVDGVSACSDVVDIGEASYAMVLADDLDNNGRLDLLVSTMNGHVYAFETPAEYHPLKTWTKQVEGNAGFVARHDWVGVYATELTRRPIDIRGTSFPVEFRIVDKAPTATEMALNATSPPVDGVPTVEQKRLGAPYAVKVLLQGITAVAMNYGNEPVIIGMSDNYQTPGAYTLEIPCPRSRSTATIHIEMTDANGVAYVHTFAQSFHMHFYRLFKWMIAGPLLCMGLFVLVLKPETAVVLPS